MTELTREDIRRWLRNGKSIKCGKIWFTIARTSHVKEGFALITSDWEVKHGRRRRLKIVTYEEILDNVNNGDWLVQIKGKRVGKIMQERAYYKVPLHSDDYPEQEKTARAAKKREIACLLGMAVHESRIKRIFKSKKFKKYSKVAVKAGAAIVGIAGAAALMRAGDDFGGDAYAYLKKKAKRRRKR